MNPKGGRRRIQSWRVTFIADAPMTDGKKLQSICPFCGEGNELKIIAQKDTVFAIKDKYPVTNLLAHPYPSGKICFHFFQS